MKANWQLFTGLAIFYAIMSVVYYYVGGEAVGITGMILAACLAGHGWLLYLVYAEANWL